MPVASATPIPPPTAAPSIPPPTPDLSPTATLQAAQVWAQRSFGSAWTLMLPTDWQTDDAGAYEGALTLHGPFEGRSYRISLRYPIFEQVPRSLAAWVDQEIRAIYADDVRPLIAETAVAGAPAAIVHGWEGVDAPADEVFIWYGQGHNPRRISVVFTDVGPSDRSVTERLLSRFLAGIAP